ncbi:MAG: YdbH domain-containing protein [Alphaproteobacteria bacterium]|nr:YdbH domain-containing protein [Alphaproteobacteria bacterium]
MREVVEAVDEEREAVVPVWRRLRWRRIALVLVGLILVVLLLLWLLRKQIAAEYIDRELARRGVQATYRVKHIGFLSERFDDLILGDPRDPDLTARTVEVRLSWGFRRPRLALIVGRGVRLKGRFADGALRFGQVDRLFPPSGKGGPFRLPDQRVDIADAILRLETPWGRAGIALEGKGNLASGFAGRASIASRSLTLGDCRLARPVAHWAVSTDVLRPHIVGPLRFASLDCGAAGAARDARFDLEATLTPGLDGWRGATGLRAAEARIGARILAAPIGRVSFAGNARDTHGRADVGVAGYRGDGVAAGVTRLVGAYTAQPRDGRFGFTGEADARAVTPPPRVAAGLVSALAGMRGTPIAPIGAAWAQALTRATQRFDAHGMVRVAVDRARGAIRVGELRAVSASGATLAFRGGDGLSYGWPGGGTRIDGQAALSGGGLPDALITLRQARAGGSITGLAHIRPYVAGSSRLALSDIVFSAAPGGSTAFDTVATIDGPFDNGRVTGLTLPIRGRLRPGGGLVVGEHCTTIGFRALQIGSLRLDAARLPLCPTGPALVWKGRGGKIDGGAAIAGLRLHGLLGRSPIAIAASGLRVGLAGPSFAATGLDVRFGPADSPNHVASAAFAGRFVRGGAEGTYGGLGGTLANVPLILSEGAGPWRLSHGAFEATGRMIVADAKVPSRFYPLASPDFRFTLAGDDIRLAGRIVEPTTGTFVANVGIAHRLGSGVGRADIDVPGVRFTPGFQPEKLTRLTVGVVALVDGTLTGNAAIAWGPNGTTSTGTFSTHDMNLAASFGPVEKLTTTIHFTDLLNLVSAPGQEGTVGAIRTGVDVFDGRIRYQILPNLRVKVEAARWPFAGGELSLDETVLDFSQPSEKRLTFHVAGMDAARFIQQMEFSNISATGTFDGRVPMIFDERGGRIVGGHLEARPPGGSLSYVGELTDKQLGAYGKLAFDALKALTYSRLVVDLNGALDGEFVAGIHLDGIARDPAVATIKGGGLKGMLANRALSQLAKIPFKFNIQVRGPFRAVIGTARSLDDPTNLIQSVLPQRLKDQPTTTSVVQPKESEPVR